MEILAHEADDELVVVGVDSVAGQPDVVGQILLSVEPADTAVFPQNALLHVLRFGR